ncbi:MAG: hypothetical protein ACTHMG_16735 [Sphingomonas sp.]
MPPRSNRIIRAALAALAAGLAVAIANPAPRIGHSLSDAMHDVVLLSSSATHAAGCCRIAAEAQAETRVSVSSSQ